jgi:hypothetical protein
MVDAKGANMRRVVILCGATSFIMAFLGGLLALSLGAPSAATAQSGPPQEVRASAFTLVGPDGTVLAELGPTANGSAGRLALRDAAGAQRVTLVGTGILNVYDQDGTTIVFRAGRTYTVGATIGLPPINGVELGPGGSIGVLP